MTDLTPLFRQCVHIVGSKFGESIEAKKNEHKKLKRSRSNNVIEDSFIKECKEYYVHLHNLHQVIKEIKSTYLSVADDLGLGINQTSLSLTEKNRIDDECKYMIQSLYRKLKILREYEQQRQETVLRQANWIGSIFSSSEEEKKELFISTTNTHRAQILKYLGNLTNDLSKSFQRMQNQRLERERQLNQLNFQNLEAESNFDAIDDYAQKTEDGTFDAWDTALEEEEQTKQTLTQEQITSLEKENQEFLSLKANQLKLVEKLHNSMLDIINLQTELTHHLDTQFEQIDNMIENQTEIELNVTLGNRKLDSATNRNKKGSNMIVSTCIIVGLLILFLDYIS